MSSYKNGGKKRNMELGYRKGFDWNNRFRKQEWVNANGTDYFVSTVDLGLDHSFGEGDPLYYETMVFLPDDMAGVYMKRYSTEEQATQGHKEVIEKLKDETLDMYLDGG